MRKMLRSQDFLLLGLAGLLDLFEEVKDPLGFVSKSYENMYGWVPKKYERSNFNQLVWRNLRTGYIEKVEKDGQICLRLSSQGNQKVKRDFPLMSIQQKPWDKKWRIATFDIKEEDRHQRDNLRYKLKELGFGMLQESVFITPHDFMKDFSEFIEATGFKDCVYIMEISKIVGDEKKLARNIWKLDDLNDKYLEIINKINEHLILVRGREKKLNKNSSEIKRIKREYLNVLLMDPFLPKELLPDYWKGEEAKKLIKRLLHE